MTSAAKHPQPGEIAPDFTLPAGGGSLVRLSDFRSRSAVVLYFYPWDETPGCTVEACAFRDIFAELREAGVEILGVSGNSADRHRKFAARYRLPFPLLSDAGGKVRALYGVRRTWGLIPGRVTFIIDREGVVRFVFDSPFQPREHIQETTGALRRLGFLQPTG